MIAVLGDSYASGEGAPDVPGKHSLGGDLFAGECAHLPWNPPKCFTETWWSPDRWFTDRKAVFPQQDDAGWQSAARRCHRSSKAPGPQAAMRLADRFPDVRIEVLDFACGGAEIGPGLLQGWAGPEPAFGDAALPSQLAALRGYVAGTNRRIDATVVNIGGNDGEFASLVAECLNLFNPFDDCTNNATLTRIREELTPDDDSPQFPDEDAPMSERYEAMNNAIEAPGNAAARPDELYLTALPNPTHDARPAAKATRRTTATGRRRRTRSTRTRRAPSRSRSRASSPVSTARCSGPPPATAGSSCPRCSTPGATTGSARAARRSCAPTRRR